MSTDAGPSGMDFAERLSLWVNAFDAIGLQAAHQSIRAIRSAAPRDVRAAPAHRVNEDVLELRAALAGAIAQEPVQAADAEASCAPYRQRHLELQRRMEQAIGPLREHLRQTLSRASAPLRQLAALDAVLERLVAPREQLLLPRTASLLERRFEALRQSGDAGWLQVFGREWRQALLAELDLRLEPVAGLVDALNNESTDRQ